MERDIVKRIADYESKTGNKYEDQPNWRKKDIRDGNWTGGGKGEKFKDPKFIKQKSEGTQIQKVRDYLSSAIRENKGKPVTFKTIAEIKKGAGVTANIDADITRVLQSDKFTNKINLRNFEKLPDEVIKEIKSSFSNLVPKDKWNFDKHKFGINKTDIDVRVYDRIRRSVEDPKPTRYGFQFANPDGWMLTQMDRAYRSGNKSYKPIYAVVNKVRKVVGYVDNTDKGGGKKYFASDIYIKGKNSDGILIKGTDKTLPHPDYAENVKYHDIVMKSGQPPNKAIRDILTKGGIAGSEKIKMRHVLNFILDNSDYNAARSSIVRHHKGQLKNATSDLQILNRVQNVKVTGIEDRISQGIILPEDVAKLKNFGVSVRGPDGTLYGGGPRTPEGGLRDINKLILEGSKNVDLYGKEIKGLKDFTKADFDKFKKSLGTLNIPKGERGFIERALLRDIAKVASRGVRTASKYFGIPDAIFATVDYLNERSKGKSKEESKGIAINNATFGLYSDPQNKAYIQGLQKTAESMGIDSSAFNSAYQLNILNKDFEKFYTKGTEQIKNLKELGLNDQAKNAQINLDRYADEQNKKYMMLQNDISDRITGGSPLTMVQGRGKVTQEQFAKPFFDMQKVALEKLKREKQSVFPTIQRKVDPAEGSMGTGFYNILDQIGQGIKNIATGRVVPFGPERFRPQPSQRQLLADELRNLSARDLQRFNLGRGLTYGQPLTDADIENLQFQQPGVFFSKCGIAGLSGGDKSGPPPERGPNPQGLLSLKNRVRNL